ncbi:MAG TPA: Asp-tRNA(Asn)/Glu-tRNA(Gln) amidotransferase subunit GatC [Actinomycetota bacterium]
MAIDKDQVRHVAKLARLAFTDDELDRFTSQLSRILEHADQVSALATEDVPPTAHAIPMTNVFRPDEVKPSLPQGKALGIGPEVEDGRFRVPRILEEA